MKKIVSLVCSFFMLFCIPIYAKEDYETQLNRILEKEGKEDNYILSKELNDLYIEIDCEIVKIKESIYMDENIADDYNLRIEYYQKKQESIKDSIVLYMKLYQCNQESKMIDVYSSNYQIMERYQKDLDVVENRIFNYKETLDKYANYINLILESQKRIFNECLDEELKEEGSYDIHSMINGIDDLPGYGGFYEANQSDGLACLAAGNYSIDSFSDSWILPIKNVSISAGTWSYPSGGIHLGMDFACSMYSNVCAPANGLILYADAPAPSNCGYLGNWIGWPAGGGNTICMICAVNNRLYAVTFAHLSNELFVSAGQQVKQGDLLALSGNSGNSSGPHCHIEVFALSLSLKDVVAYFMQGADFSFGNGYSQKATCSPYACRIRPESVWG